MRLEILGALLSSQLALSYELQFFEDPTCGTPIGPLQAAEGTFNTGCVSFETYPGRGANGYHFDDGGCRLTLYSDTKCCNAVHNTIGDTDFSNCRNTANIMLDGPGFQNWMSYTVKCLGVDNSIYEPCDG